MKTIRVLIAALTVAWPVASQANLILNGSFEESSVHPSNWVTVYEGSTTIAGWIVTRDTIDLNGGYWLAQDGSQSLDLDGTLSPTGGAIAQSFATIPGQLYQVTFALAGNPDSCGLRRIEVSAANSSADFEFDSCGKTYSEMGWVIEEWAFSAASSTTTLEFSSLSPVGLGYGPALDNVTVAAVPEPATFELLGCALALLGVRSRASRRPT